MPDYVPALQARVIGIIRHCDETCKIARECRLADEIHANKDLML